MQILNRSGYMDTPIEYMYQNPCYGGAGQQPAPPFYGQQIYNPIGQPMGFVYPNIIQSPMQQETITTQDGQEIVNCPMPAGLSAASMPQQFQYQNDWRYQYYGNSPSYYNGYGTAFSNQYGYNQNPYKYYEPGYYNPFNSPQLVEGLKYDKPFEMPGYTSYDCGNQYFTVVQQQQIIQEANRNHMQTCDMLSNLVGKINGYDQEEIERQKQRNQEERNKQYQRWYEYNNEAQLCSFINKLSSMQDPDVTYESPARRRYIEEWNRKYDDWVEEFGEPTMYEFFNNGVGENQYMQCKINDAIRRDTQLNKLYDRQAFRNYLASQHPGYNPQTGLSQYVNTQSRMPLTIDDMEIRLPDHIKNTDEFKRKEKFINEAMKKMTVSG